MKLRAPAMTEEEFHQQVTHLAALYGWRVNHHRPTPTGRTGDRWTTATTVKGWPDLTLWRPGALLFRELKTDTGRLTADQREVLAELAAAGADVEVWRPRDFDRVLTTLRDTGQARPFPSDERGR